MAGLPTLRVRAGVEVGDRVDVELRVAKEKLAGGEARLESLTPSQQRMLREDVAAAKQPETRRKQTGDCFALAKQRMEVKSVEPGWYIPLTVIVVKRPR